MGSCSFIRLLIAADVRPRARISSACPKLAAVKSNLALKFASSLLSLSKGSTYASLALAMVGFIVIGMGLPTVAAYIIGAVLFVPALPDMGIQPLAAHFFIFFYYYVLSMVTPPVALASFAAAAVGDTSVVKTPISAFGLSLVAFLILLGFVYDMGVLGQGGVGNVIISALALLASTALWAVTFGGWCGRSLSLVARTLVGTAGLIAALLPAGSTLWMLVLTTGWGMVVIMAVLSCKVTVPGLFLASPK